MKRYIKIRTAIPGPKAAKKLKQFKQLNGGWGVPYPFIQGKEGQGCYIQDIDRNSFLDFASHVASTPLGYNHPAQIETLKQYQGFAPIKIAGQDFPSEEHVNVLEELTKIMPNHMNTAFLTNSGAEAVENCMKVAMKKKKTGKIGISFEGAFHGRTLGALSATNSKRVHKEHCLSFPMLRLPFDETAPEKLQELLNRECSAEDIAYLIVEPVQGEGGYRIPPPNMLKKIRKITKQNNIPMITDEVQAGMGRTGQWWAHQNFDIKPDLMSSAKALQVGATMGHKSWFPKEPGSLSTTWGGGHLIDLAMSLSIIKTIKKEKLLLNAKRQGKYLRQRLTELAHTCNGIHNIRGLGLMNAFDVPKPEQRNNLVMELFKNGVLTLGCGAKGIRLIPPLIVDEPEIDVFMEILDCAVKKCNKKFRHTGNICEFVGFAEHHG